MIMMTAMRPASLSSCCELQIVLPGEVGMREGGREEVRGVRGGMQERERERERQRGVWTPGGKVMGD
jgi:hypothetical protein